MMLAAGMQLSSLGYIWGHQEVMLGYGALLLTPLAVWGRSTPTTWSMASMGSWAPCPASPSWRWPSCSDWAAGKTGAVVLGLIVALAAYLLFNLSLFGARNKIFMGDAGSMVIGFSVLWLVLLATQGPQAVMRPVTALWLIAIPLMDMVTVMVRRLLRRQSPFKAGRDHLHHILMRRGLNARRAGNEHHAGGDAGLRRHLQRSVEAAGKPDAGGVSALFLRLFRHAA